MLNLLRNNYAFIYALDETLFEYAVQDFEYRPVRVVATVGTEEGRE